MNRRNFVNTLAAIGASYMVARRLFGGQPEKPGPYKQANTDWLAKCRYGDRRPLDGPDRSRHGDPLPFQQAVDAFN